MAYDAQTANDVSYKNRELPIGNRVEALLSQMTLTEKIGQMTQAEKNSITPEDVSRHAIGSVLSGGGGNPTPNTPRSWWQMVSSFQEAAIQSRLAIPLLYGSDAVHGHNNVKGAVIFPHNVGLGAARDAELVETIGRVTAKECAATGVQWAFAPAVSVPQDPRWGRTYEGYSENTELVSTLGTALLRGLQHTESAALPGVLGCLKHYVADGGTRWGSATAYPWLYPLREGNGFKIDQGNAEIDERTLRAIHLPPYQAAIEAGAMSIMVSYSSWQGLKMHAHKYLLTDVLKNEFGFNGFIVSDWQAIDQIDPDYYTCVVRSINAGLDMIMVPFDFKRFINALKDALERGDIRPDRIDDAVRRILRVKFQLGLFEHPITDDSRLPEVGHIAHRELARRAVQKSLVLLKNEDHVLPLSSSIPKLLIVGQAADDLGYQCGGWSIEWMGRSGDITLGTTILQGIRQIVSPATDVLYEANAEFSADTQASVGIAVIAEAPYAEGLGDCVDLALPATDIALINRLREHCSSVVVILLSGRPLIVTEFIAEWDAFVAAWLPGTEGQGVADVLFGNAPFTGSLPYTWPRDASQISLNQLNQPAQSHLWVFGFGLRD